MDKTLELPDRVDLDVIAPGVAVSVGQYVEWLDQQDGRYEYDRGTVGMMVNVTAGHAELVWNFVSVLTTQIDVSKYQVFSEAFALHTAESIRFPDVLVQRRDANRNALRSADPLVIVEVVSQSSLHLDTVVKRDEYLALSTLASYIVASPNNPAADVWIRGEDGRFPDAPLELEGFHGSIELSAIGATLAMADIYRHLKDDPTLDGSPND